ncbi:succinylglutamate desuccinylase [Curvivirga sp.]|uniref:succinylglutamate desuccinylase n=1 Tax=Curvivirga sp. TaxID=2856848 RepID=UPI003B5A3E98
MLDQIEIKAPDISAFREGNTGIDFVHQFDSGIEGPHVGISAIIHGNEICGSVALTHLLKNNTRPLIGKLSLIFMNIGAYELFNPDRPYASRYVDEDFNRIWDPVSLNGPANTKEKRRAQQIRPIIDDLDYLLDIHSMGDICPPITLCGPSEKGLNLAQSVLASEIVVIDEGHASGCRLRDYGDFNNPASLKNALLIECGQHWHKSSATVAIEASYRFLHHFKMISDGVASPYLSDRAKPQKILEVTDVVTVKNDAFFFDLSPEPLQKMPHKDSLIGRDGTEAIRTPYNDCYFIMPQQGARCGQTAVRLAKEINN